MGRMKHLARRAHPRALLFGHIVLAQSMYFSTSRLFIRPVPRNERSRVGKVAQTISHESKPHDFVVETSPDRLDQLLPVVEPLLPSNQPKQDTGVRSITDSSRNEAVHACGRDTRVAVQWYEFTLLVWPSA